jgi:hypothetical protein
VIVFPARNQYNRYELYNTPSISNYKLFTMIIGAKQKQKPRKAKLKGVKAPNFISKGKNACK